MPSFLYCALVCDPKFSLSFPSQRTDPLCRRLRRRSIPIPIPADSSDPKRRKTTATTSPPHPLPIARRGIVDLQPGDEP
jgi:hypothetical protein